MAVLSSSVQHLTPFNNPWFLRGGHAQTVWPSFFRKVETRIQPKAWQTNTPDDDVLAGDFYEPEDAAAIAVICHGLEGHARRPYVLGMVQALTQAGFAVLAWNYRSCGGTMNKQARFYHSGATDDLQAVINQLPGDANWPVYLVGFSLGGNLVLRYLGEQGSRVSSRIAGAGAISVPLFLADGADHLNQGLSKLYIHNFLKSLEAKIKEKAPLFPGVYRTEMLGQLRSLRDFDEHFTAPIHGYANADDYYARASAGFLLNDICRPVLLLQALNDPFLPHSCFPKSNNRLITNCFVPQGGHCGFVQAGNELSYADISIRDFWKKL